MLKKIKVLLRSKSLRFTQDLFGPITGTVNTFRYNERNVYYRPGTSDPHLIYGILLKSGRKAEYFFPAQFSPKVILDIGANIGVSSALFADTFPQAQVHSIEPMPDNFEILKLNAAERPQIKPHCLALADKAGTMEMFASEGSTNFGGFSFYKTGSNINKSFSIPTATPSDFLQNVGLEQIDLIKIDTEGAEEIILKSFPAEVLARTTWITGELHGQNDFELLAYLSQWFDIELKKSFKKRLFIFRACNKNALHLLN